MALRPAIPLLFLLALSAQAQDDPGLEEHTKIESVTAEPKTVRPGEAFELIFKIKIDPTWHIYAANGKHAPTEWAFEGPVERAGAVIEPKPKEHREELGKNDDGTPRLLEYGYHEGDVTFRVPLRLSADAPAGPLKIKGKITGQECDPRICIGLDIPFDPEITVAGDAVKAKTKVVSVTPDPAKVKAGEKFHLVVKVAVDKGWHINSAIKEGVGIKTAFEFESPIEPGGDVEEPAPKHKRDDFPDGGFMETYTHEGEVTFRVPVKVKAGTSPGTVKVKGFLTGQECADVCMDLKLPISTDVEVGTGTAAEEPQDLGALIVLAIIGGLVSLIMPCVYPLLPITLTYFIKQGGESRARSIAMSTAYALGIIIVFTGVGFLFSLILGADGPRLFAANPWVNIAVALLFFWFAFSLFGLYEITLPSWLTGSLTGAQRSGVGGAFILGALFSIVTFTCTIPIAATILGVAATEGASNRFTGLVAMLVYSITMAVPFFILGLFPRLLKEVPKSGGWLHTVKVTAAFAELALALLYLAKADQVTATNILTRPVMMAIWVAVLALMAFYLLGVFRMKGDDPPGPIGLPRVLVALSFIVLAVYVGSGFTGRSLGEFDILLPVDTSGGTATKGEKKPHGIGNYEDALAAAKKEGKPIFLEFTGFT